MKKQISYLSVAILSAGLFFSSCKKENNNNANDYSVEFKTQSDDQARFTSETDAVAEDATAALENAGGTYAGETPIGPLLHFACDASVVVDTVSSPRTITVTYNGDSCVGGHRRRTGSIQLSFAAGFRWANAGAQYTVTYQNLKITRTRDNKSITINGAKTITNVSGGKLRNLATRTTPIVHEVSSSNMNITFDDGTQRTWNIAKRRTFTYNNGIVISVTGIASAGGGIAEWGVNRFNHNFTSAILEPLVVKQSCDFRLVSGKIQHTGFAGSATTTFGLDVAGNPVSICPAGSFYYKIVWAGVGGNTMTYIGEY
jgi:hypothetical protein